jgi:hypothetical protein
LSAWIYFGVKLAHVLAMSIWVGGPFIAVFQLRIDAATVERLLTVTPLFIASALLTLATGAALAVLHGVSTIPLRIWIGAGLAPLIFAVGGLMNRPALLGLRAHFATGAGEAEPLLRRFFLAHRIEMALRLTILALMVLPI